MKLFHYEKTKSDKILLYILGIKIQFNAGKNYFSVYKRNFYILVSKLLAGVDFSIKRRKYDEIILLGRDCEFATVYKYYHKSFVDSSLFNWALYNDKKEFFNAVKNPDVLFSENQEHIAEHNMWKCTKTGYMFHSNSRPEALLGKDGNVIPEKREAEKQSLLEKIKYLKEKNNNLYKSDCKKLYIFTFDFEEKKIDIEEIKELYNYFKNQNKNFDMTVILEKDKYDDEIKSFEQQFDDLFVRKICYFRTRKNTATCLDYVYYKNWADIFKEFSYKKARKKSNKKLKCDF